MKQHKFYRPPENKAVDLSTIPNASVKTDARQVMNDAGGFVFAADDLEVLRRFLILGAAGTYYKSGDEVVLSNLKVLDRIMGRTEPKGLVEFFVDMRPRVPSSKTLVASLAYMMKFGEPELKRVIADNVSRLLWTGDDLMRYLSFCKAFQRGWGRAQTRLVNNWYNSRKIDALTLQMLKYKGRYGWTQKDILKLGSVAPQTIAHDALYAYVVARVRGGEDRYNAAWKKVVNVYEHDLNESHQKAMNFLLDVERMWSYFGEGNIEDGISIAAHHKMPWELLPSQILDSWQVWDGYLLDAIGPRALLRHLNRLSKMGIGNMTDQLDDVWDKFHDPEWISGAHPASIAIALMQYGKGISSNGDNQWPVSPTIERALDEAFIASYSTHSLLGNDTSKKLIVAVDVSPSMHGSVVDGIGGMKAVDVAALMTSVFVRGERAGSVLPMAFASSSGRYTLGSSSSGVSMLQIDSRSSVKEVYAKVLHADWGGGGTDCSLPFVWALANNVKADVIVITDYETWAGKSPNAALERYRKDVYPAARLVVVATTPSDYQISDPRDPLSMNVVGFDTAAPQIIELFMRGEL